MRVYDGRSVGLLTLVSPEQTKTYNQRHTRARDYDYFSHFHSLPSRIAPRATLLSMLLALQKRAPGFLSRPLLIRIPDLSCG